MQGKGCRDSEAWQKAMDLVVQCGRAFKCSPESDAYVLATLILRVAVPANIARGHESESRGACIRDHGMLQFGNSSKGPSTNHALGNQSEPVLHLAEPEVLVRVK